MTAAISKEETRGSTGRGWATFAGRKRLGFWRNEGVDDYLFTSIKTQERRRNNVGTRSQARLNGALS